MNSSLEAMNLSSAYILVGAIFCLIGGLTFLNNSRWAAMLNALPRNRVAGILLWSAALTWFFFHLTTMSEVDFAGFPRWSFFALFGGAGFLAFKFLSDLLPLRALAVLTLFASNELLKIGFGQTPYSCVLAGTSYLLIIGALWVGAAPYVLRNAIDYTTQNSTRSRIVGSIIFLIGLLNFSAILFLP